MINVIKMCTVRIFIHLFNYDPGNIKVLERSNIIHDYGTGETFLNSYIKYNVMISLNSIQRGGKMKCFSCQGMPCSVEENLALKSLKNKFAFIN